MAVGADVRALDIVSPRRDEECPWGQETIGLAISCHSPPLQLLPSTLSPQLRLRRIVRHLPPPHSLVVQQPFLPPQPAPVPGQAAIRPDHPVARDYDGDPIVAICPSDRPHRPRRADQPRLLHVAPGLGEGDFPERVPDAALEVASVGDERRRELP